MTEAMPEGLDALVAGLAEDRDERELMERALRMLAFAAEPAEPPPSLRDRVMARIAASSLGPTFEAHDNYFARGAEIEWKQLVPGIELKELYRDAETGARTVLVKMAPNLLFPGHAHHGIEDLYLIEGEAWVGDIPMRAGDYCRAPAGTEHNDVRSGPPGSLAIVVTR